VSTERERIDPAWDEPDAYGGGLPPDWDARRRAVYRRDGYTCTRCGRESGPHADDKGGRLHAHHRTPRAAGGSNRLDNLATLCEPCHDRAHDHDVFAGSGRIGDSGAGTSRGIGATLVRTLVVLVASLPLLLPVGGVYARYLDGNPRLPLVAELALLVGVVLVAGTVVLRRPRTVLAGSVLLGAVGAGAVWTGDVQPTAATLGLFVATTGVPILLLAGGLLAGVLDR
jgi:hypothetical protein